MLLKTGAKGLEIRHELLSVEDLRLIQTENFLKNTGLHLVYSAPKPVWKEDGKLNDEIKSVIQRADQLQCDIIKFSLGGYESDKSNLANLQEVLMKARHRNPNLILTVENDQTHEGGRIKRILEFLTACEMASVPVFLTFDIGNWLYVHDDPLEAAHLLHRFVRYIHVKHVEIQNGEFVTLPIPLYSDLYQKLLMHLPNHVPRCIEFLISDDNAESNLVQFIKFLSA